MQAGHCWIGEVSEIRPVNGLSTRANAESAAEYHHNMTTQTKKWTVITTKYPGRTREHIAVEVNGTTITIYPLWRTDWPPVRKLNILWIKFLFFFKLRP